MINLNCPICEHPIELPDSTRAGTRLTCPNCFAQLGLFKHKGKHVLACAMCAEPVFDPANCADCERRREKKKIYEEGTL